MNSLVYADFVFQGAFSSNLLRIGSGFTRCLEIYHDPDRLPTGVSVHHLLRDTGIAGGAEEIEADLHIHPIHIAGDPVCIFTLWYLVELEWLWTCVLEIVFNPSFVNIILLYNLLWDKLWSICIIRLTFKFDVLWTHQGHFTIKIFY